MIRRVVVEQVGRIRARLQGGSGRDTSLNVEELASGLILDAKGIQVRGIGVEEGDDHYVGRSRGA